MLKAVPPCLALALVAAPAWAQLPAGPEFQVNTYTTGNQSDSAVAVDAAGNFVVVWRGTQDDLGDIFGQRFNASGAPSGAEFRVNSTLGGEQSAPAVAKASTGAFVVVWDGFDYSSGGIKGQRYDALGTPAGAEFRVNTYFTGNQYWGSVSADASGNFVVVWSSFQQDGSGSGVFGRRFSSAGTPLGVEFQVNSYTTGYQNAGRVALDADGDFVVVWQSLFRQDGDGIGVFGQRFSAAGVAVGSEFQVNTATAGSQRYPAVSSDGTGRFVVVWDSPAGYCCTGVFARRYDASGAPVTGEFLLSQNTGISQASAAVDHDVAGNFVVTWSSYSLDADGRSIRGRLFDPLGVPLGGEFQANTYTTGDQAFSSVALGNHGDVVVVWESWGQDAPASGGVFGQRYSDLIFGDGFDPSGP